jgi:hypothetical protein
VTAPALVGPFMIRQVLLPLRLPMQVADGRLLQASPKDAFTVFPTVEAAQAAIGAEREPEQFEVLTLAEWEAELTASERRQAKLAEIKRQKKRSD